AAATLWRRSLSPIPAVLEVLGQGDLGTRGMAATGGAVPRYAVLALASSLACALATIVRLNHALLDRARPPGVPTQDRPFWEQVLRRLVYVVDPDRRAGGISDWVNPVMAKEFRTRRFRRSHWALRTIAACALL